VHAAFVAGVVEHVREVADLERAVQLGHAVAVRMGGQRQGKHLQAGQRSAVRFAALPALAVWWSELALDVLGDRTEADGAQDRARV